MIAIQENIPLKGYTTMRLGGSARYLASVASKDDLLETLKWAADRQLAALMIGGGANIIFGDGGYNGLVLVNDIKGIEIYPKDDKVILRAGAGEVWDDVVAHSVGEGLSGLEALSLIPGKTGAAAVQNIGAYGQEVAQTMLSLEAYDTQTQQFIELSSQECQFAYRSSRFNRIDRGRFLITALTFRLAQTNPAGPFYKDIEAYLAGHPSPAATPAVIRDAVCAIRRAKLPQPDQLPNAGSFFYNPIISREAFDKLSGKHPELNEARPGWTQPPRWFLEDGRVKLSAGRLIELAGMDTYDNPATGIAVWPKQHLVLVNKSAKTTADLLAAKQAIVDAVHAKFDIELQQEPELVELTD